MGRSGACDVVGEDVEVGVVGLLEFGCVGEMGEGVVDEEGEGIFDDVVNEVPRECGQSDVHTYRRDIGKKKKSLFASGLHIVPISNQRKIMESYLSRSETHQLKQLQLPPFPRAWVAKPTP